MAGVEGPTRTDEGAAETTSKASLTDQIKLTVTRRNFLIGAGAGAAAGAVLGGGAVVATRAVAPPAPTTTTIGAPLTALPATMRRVSLDIDGVQHTLAVDNRESLWETMNFQLGLGNSNLGCDRAQCGACAVLVDGKAVNGCTVLSARLGRGQKIMTVASLAKGAGVAGLHPVQRAFWLNGGFQCGICTRGFIMSTVALLGAVPKPTTEQIQEGLAGNICRCGEYAKVFKSVEAAGAEMRGESVTYLSKAVTVDAVPEAPKPTVAGTSKSFEFATAFATIEEFDPFAEDLRKKEGILGVSGSERAVTIRWDPDKLSEARLRELLISMGRAVR